MEALTAEVEECIIIKVISAWAAPSARVVVSQVVVTDLLSVRIVGPVRCPPVVAESLK
jgi:hypothetical protein